MNTDKLAPTSNSVEVYRIRIKGQLDPSWSDWLGGFTIRSQGDDSTLLVGPIVDQAALQGILNKLYGMKYSVFSNKEAGLLSATFILSIRFPMNTKTTPLLLRNAGQDPLQEMNIWNNFIMPDSHRST